VEFRILRERIRALAESDKWINGVFRSPVRNSISLFFPQAKPFSNGTTRPSLTPCS